MRTRLPRQNPDFLSQTKEFYHRVVRTGACLGISACFLLGSSSSQKTLDTPLLESTVNTEIQTPHPMTVLPVVAKVPLPKSTTSMALTLDQANLAAPFVELGAIDSLPEESFDRFMVRVAKSLDWFTRETQYEGCGLIMVNEQENAWRVRLTTNRSHIGCVMIDFQEVGFKRLGPDIHSHPHLPEGAVANHADIQRRRDFECGSHLKVFDERFSETDFAHGPGYLVSRGRLLYQRGKQWPIQQRSVFSPIDETPNWIAGGIMVQLGQEAAMDATSQAFWSNQDHEHLPTVSCKNP